jgi:hypothetical protein
MEAERPEELAESAPEVSAPTCGRQEPGFFGPPDAQLFGTMHIPDGAVIGALVIAPPILGELETNYRREVLLARLLATEGVATLRFHYRGTGHSDGSALDLTFESMLEDLQHASTRVRDQVHVDQPILLGTRLGGLLVMIANRHGGPLALWEPTTDGAQYLRELRRVKLMGRIAHHDQSGVSLDPFAGTEVIDYRGHPLTRPLFDTTGSRTAGAAPHPSAAFLVQLRPQPKLGDDYLRLVHTWQSSGSTVDWLINRTVTGWWLTEDVHRGDWTESRSLPYIRATADWIVRECESVSKSAS